MKNYVKRDALLIQKDLANFVEMRLVDGLDFDAPKVWSALSELVTKFTQQNRDLLQKRSDLHEQIQLWQANNRHLAVDGINQHAFLTSIGYLVPEPGDFEITTTDTDPEISIVSGPQLVVPVSNARYALNAANARWGSLYDALYGTDAIMAAPTPGPYSQQRGAAVIAWTKQFLDRIWPLVNGSHTNVQVYAVKDGQLICDLGDQQSSLRDREKFVGYTGPAEAPQSIILSNNGLHSELLIDRSGRVGFDDAAGLDNILLESAMTSIIDFEDSVAAVDGEDKSNCYANWLGLMKGDLEATFEKNGHPHVRRMNSPKAYITPGGAPAKLPGQSRLLVRNVGHLMTTPAVLSADGDEIFEGLLDALLTSLIACHGLASKALTSIYIVKPKMHGPEEARFANSVFDCVEDLIGLPRNTIKIGLMDEERRTSANLKATIFELRGRIMFINTGFLDRTGDEINTALEAGPVLRKQDMKGSPWLDAYERGNVVEGLRAGFMGRAQIGKGMWAKPDYMSAMLEEKISHPSSGADCAWVPSPTAATLHAIHYHYVNVDAVQNDILSNHQSDNTRRFDLLAPPVLAVPAWTSDQIATEIENCCQGILGYVVRWIDRGVGCSKVPDIHNIGLMEDRATLRISCQLLGNWLHHGVIEINALEAYLLKMAAVVDAQNATDPHYRPMLPDTDENIAFQAARELILTATTQPNGYTEPVLHRRRLERKAQLASPAKPTETGA